jgi:flagellar biosynthetic protein FliR
MISFTSEQLYTLVASLVWPLTRILGLISIAPPFGSASVPMLVKILLGTAISFAIGNTIPIPTGIDPMSMTGLLILFQQFLIGLSMGFAVRIIFASVEMAGELTSTGMGLGFAVFFDPQSQGRSSALTQFYSLTATMVFLSMNGHLIVLAVLAESFNTLPITPNPISAVGFHMLAKWGAQIFSIGLQISLPVVTALLITNFALGILTRAAPQLNLFGIGFTITLLAGFFLVGVTLPLMLHPLERFLSDSIELVRLLGNVPTIKPIPQ